MKVYFSGITGTGLGPLALMAKDAGLDVVGSDKNTGAILTELKNHDIPVDISSQNGEFLKNQGEIDWFVYTSALPEDHAELVFAKTHPEIVKKVTKRDEFTNFLIEKLHLKLIAVAGTHGKTTTTSMLIWVAKQLHLPAAYVSGTTLNFAPSGAYHKNDRYFFYEADEYDRNFLTFHPWLSLIPYISYDHSDIYHSRADYIAAFNQFIDQSRSVIFANFPGVEEFLSRDPLYLQAKKHHLSPGLAKLALADSRKEQVITLSGAVRRRDASLAAEGLFDVIIDMADLGLGVHDPMEILDPLNAFPGVGRRFEQIAPGFYSDYAHHPEEISATLEIAREEAEKTGKTGVVVVYEPHQNSRQHAIRHQYFAAFKKADKIFWLPTFLTREDKTLEILSPETLIKGLKNRQIASPATLTPEFAAELKNLEENGNLILLLSAGPADAWFRANFAKKTEG